MLNPTKKYYTRLYAYIYLRLSDDDIQKGESGSIKNQRRIIHDYCELHGIIIVGEFIDDGWSGGNFERPGFQHMMQELKKSRANVVITKDLSRLGRDMRETSYYAEQFFPENGIRYIAISDNFDTEQENIMAPFQYAMNEVYLRDGSRKVKDALRSMRENGLYCACPPYGYRKDSRNKNLLVPDENTAPIVQRIFEQASRGDSCQQIASELTDDRIDPPLKYRVLYRDNFCDDGAARASDKWNHITVRRILKNQVYLGHTVLGKTKKASLKSKKKISLDRDEWAITKNTHQPLVSQEIFDLTQDHLKVRTKKWQDSANIRKNIFAGLVVCGKCGHSMCSCGTIYKGDKFKYWHLSCAQQRKEAIKPCPGVRIRYTDLVDVVKTELNELLALTEEDIQEVINSLTNKNEGNDTSKNKKMQIEKAQARISTIDKIIPKLYSDNAEGRISDERFEQMLDDLEKETLKLKEEIEALSRIEETKDIEIRLNYFFSLVDQYTHIDELTPEILSMFIDKIVIGEKVLPKGVKRDIHGKHPFTQEIQIFYKFIGNLFNDNVVEFESKEVREAQKQQA